MGRPSGVSRKTVLSDHLFQHAAGEIMVVIPFDKKGACVSHLDVEPAGNIAFIHSDWLNVRYTVGNLLKSATSNAVYSKLKQDKKKSIKFNRSVGKRIFLVYNKYVANCASSDAATADSGPIKDQ